MNDLFAAEPDAVWDEIAPQLDAALGELSEPDRDALLLRYFERKSAREMAQRLGTSEEAAQKRVSRAVGRLRELLAKRGVTAGASGLVMLLGANAVQAAPAGLAAASCTAALLGGAAVTTLTTATVAKTFAMTTLQKTLVITTLVAARGVGSYEAWHAARAQAQVKLLQHQQPPAPETSLEAARLSLQAKVEWLEATNRELTRALAQANADKVRLENERQLARHSAALFKELADHASAQSRSATNEFPTCREVMAGWGRFGRLAVQFKKDESQLSAEERATLATAKVKAIEELAKLVKATKELDLEELENAPEEEQCDSIACLLYGALNLDEQQFGTVRTMVQKYYQQLKQKEGSSGDATPEVAEARKEMMEQAQAEIKSILNPEQAEVFALLLPSFKFGTNNWNLGFNF